MRIVFYWAGRSGILPSPAVGGPEARLRSASPTATQRVAERPKGIPQGGPEQREG